MTQAEEISGFLENDGSNFETADGLTLSDICEIYEGKFTQTVGEEWRYDFEDGSAIVGDATAWDIDK